MKNTIKTSLVAICLFFSYAITAQNKALETKSYDQLWELYSETKDDSLKLNSAKAYYAKALQDNDRIKQLEGNFAVAKAFEQCERPELGLPYIDSAIELSATQKSKKAPYLLLQSCKSYLHWANEDYTIALKTIDNAFLAHKNNKDLKPKNRLVIMQRTAALIYIATDSLVKAENAINNSIKISKNQKDSPFLEQLLTYKSQIKALKEMSYEELYQEIIDQVNRPHESTLYTYMINVSRLYHSRAKKGEDLNKQYIANFLMAISHLKFNLSKIGFSYTSKTKELSKSIKNEKVLTLLLLNWKSRREFFNKEYQEAIKTIDSSLTLSKKNKKLKPLSSLVMMHYTAAEIFFLKKDYKESLERINQGIALSKTLKEKPVLKLLNIAKSLIFTNKSLSEKNKGKYLESLKNLDSLSNNNLTVDDKYIGELYELAALGTLKSQAEDYREARKIFQTIILKTKEKKNDKGILTENYLEKVILAAKGSISSTYLKEFQPDSALYYLKQVEKRDSLFSFSCGEFNLHNLKASAFIQKEEFNNAENSMKKAITICDTIAGRAAENAFLFGQIYNGRKEYKKAQKVLFNAIPSYETEQKQDPEYIDYYKHLAAAYKGLNKLDSASIYLEKYIELKELEEKKRFEVAGAFKQRNEALFKSELSGITEEKGKKETLLYYGSIGALVVFLIMGAALILNYKKRKENQQKFDVLFAKVTAAKAPEDIINTKDLELEAQTTAAVNEETTKQILKGLQKLEKENYFLHPGCNAHNVAKRIKTNTTYLSKVINSEFNKNFSTYVNDLRINYAIIKLKQDTKFRRYTISSIAKELGYKSADSFTKYFKKDTGLLPSFYIKKLNKIA